MVGTRVSSRPWNKWDGKGLPSLPPKKEPPHSTTALMADWCGGCYRAGCAKEITPGEPWRAGLSTLTIGRRRSRRSRLPVKAWRLNLRLECLLGRVYRTKDIGSHHVHPRVKRVPKENLFQVFGLRQKLCKERSANPIPFSHCPDPDLLFFVTQIVHDES